VAVPEVITPPSNPTSSRIPAAGEVVGHSRTSPLPKGEQVVTEGGLGIQVLSVDIDAEEAVLAEN
jgi:hypothetical protein